MTTDTDRINALEKMSNLAIWHGSWADHMGEKAGKQIRSISAMNDDGDEVLDEIGSGETIRDAIDNFITQNQQKP